jgi:hypothetical protein
MYCHDTEMTKLELRHITVLLVMLGLCRKVRSEQYCLSWYVAQGGVVRERQKGTAMANRGLRRKADQAVIIENSGAKLPCETNHAFAWRGPS